MKFTDEQIETIKNAVQSIDFGSITIQFCASSHFVDIEIRQKLRLDKETDKILEIKA